MYSHGLLTLRSSIRLYERHPYILYGSSHSWIQDYFRCQLKHVIERQPTAPTVKSLISSGKDFAVEKQVRSMIAGSPSDMHDDCKQKYIELTSWCGLLRDDGLGIAWVVEDKTSSTSLLLSSCPLSDMVITWLLRTQWGKSCKFDVLLAKCSLPESMRGTKEESAHKRSTLLLEKMKAQSEGNESDSNSTLSVTSQHRTPAKWMAAWMASMRVNASREWSSQTTPTLYSAAVQQPAWAVVIPGKKSYSLLP